MDSSLNAEHVVVDDDDVDDDNNSSTRIFVEDPSELQAYSYPLETPPQPLPPNQQ
jgi:hypothetical protein